MKIRTLLIGLLALALSGSAAVSAAAAQDGAIAIRASWVHTLTGDDNGFGPGVVVVQDGRITAVGGPDTPIPDGAEIIDATAEGMGVFPGMFDAVTRVGLTEIGQVAVTSDFRELGNNNPHLFAATAVHPASEIIPVSRSTGITHAVAAPQGNGIAGQGSLIHLDGWTVEEMLIERSAYMVVQWPRLGGGGRFGGRRFGGGRRSFSEMQEQYETTIADLEALLDDARRYAAADVGDDPLRRDLKLEALTRMIDREIPVAISVDDRRGIRDAIAFGERQNLDIIIAGGSDAWKIADEVAAADVPVILGPVQSMPTNENDSYDSAYTRPAKLHEAGVKFAISTYNASSSRVLPFEAAQAVMYGLPYEEALKAVSLYPAQILGVDDQLGTIEEGKIANLFVSDGDPLEITSQVTHIIINGRDVGTDNKHERLYRRWSQRPTRTTGQQ